jgi:RNA polymerase sigma-70 factor (ECF subfamily)
MPVVDAYDPNREFERLLRPHLDRLYRFAHRLTTSSADAEDLFQEVMAKIYARLAEVPDLQDTGSWLCRVMYNLYIDQQRRFIRRRLVSVEENRLPGKSVESCAGGEDPIVAAQLAEDIMHLDRALSVLSDEQRLILMLHDVEGYKLKEIQAFTEEPMGTLKSRLHRARARLREIVADDATFS